MPRPSSLVAAISIILAAPVRAAETVVRMAATRDGAPATTASDPTLAFAVAALALCVALYAVHRLVHRKVRRT